MQAARLSSDLTRRSLIVSCAAMLAPSIAEAALPDARPWIAYRDRMVERLQDAGGGQFDLALAHRLLAAGNVFRNTQALPKWEWDEELATCARAHLADMVQRDYFAHKSPDGFSHIDRVSLLSRDFCGGAAENLAWRPSQGQTDAHHIHRMWENSASHRKNLLNGAFDRVGYAIVRSKQRVFAAAMYGSVDVRLTRAMPLSVGSKAELIDVIRGASPAGGHFSLTAPFERPTWMKSPTDVLPQLQPGVWQFRPLRPVGGTKYDILTGPIFELAA